MLNRRGFMSVCYILDGLKLICKPGIRQFVVMPLLINIIIFSGLLALSGHYFHAFDLWFAAHLPAWLHWFASALWIVFFLVFFTFFIYTFTLLSNLVAAPFNSLLAEKVERYLTGKTPDPRRAVDLLRDLLPIVLRQLRITGYYLIRAGLIGVLFFIPLFQPVAAGLWFVFNAWFMALQYLDYPADNQRVSLPALRTAMKQRLGTSFGLGFGIAVFAMVPGLNFVVMPAAIAGATKAWIEAYQQQH